jgi:hypothetical protein
MAESTDPQVANTPNCSDIGDLDRAAQVRRQAAWRLSMSERLAQVHELCRQMNAVKGVAGSR